MDDMLNNIPEIGNEAEEKERETEATPESLVEPEAAFENPETNNEEFEDNTDASINEEADHNDDEAAPDLSKLLFSTPEPEKKEKKAKLTNGKTNLGRLIFIIIICLSIAFVALALGITMATSDVLVPNENENNFESIDGAEPNLQESPIVFEEYDGEGSMTPAQVYDYVKDTNVGVLVYYNGEMIGEGSGIIVGEDEAHQYTYIITAAHVIYDSGVEVEVQFSDETEADATIIGYDEKTDIGVIRVEKTGLQAAVFGNSDNLVVGQAVYAIGNPGGTEFFGSFTSGIVSAIDRPIPTTSSAYDLPCIQHNAAINPGNSGGALVNEFGQVIGLNSSKIASMDYEGMGFAVPSNTIIQIYESILANGYVAGRPMLGINYIPASSDEFYNTIVQENDLPSGTIVIASISESSDLNNHDVIVGDLIIAVNGEDLNSTDILPEIVAESSIGTEIELTICRVTSSGEISDTFDVTVVIVEDIGDNVAPDPQGQSDSLEDYIYGDDE